ncbi:hypothetical protein GOV05_00840 [Candidatus Woesearchaeota archaeon]|nr:hypothetical protein [Candidatus Woesearchaeota archaeon]
MSLVLETLSDILEKLQILLIVTIPVFGILYKETFLFFVPIVIFLILGFGFVKREILRGKNEDAITRMIITIGKWTLFLWVLEFGIYIAIKYVFG